MSREFSFKASGDMAFSLIFPGCLKDPRAGCRWVHGSGAGGAAFAILSSINLLACAIALGQGLSPISGTVKESRHYDRRGEITSDATPPSATTAPYRVLQLAMKYLF
jgi:hypothetical protein